MGEIENRYAIIIGINDYDTKPLRFCVNDAEEIKDALINKCKFNEENVFIITSGEESSEKDITGKYREALREIRNNFNSNKDSILFYFAGHGSCVNSKSVLWFQNSTYPIEEIFSDFSILNPKIQTYVIDACESGSKVLTRNNDDKLEDYIKSSQGAMFLYACRTNEYASEIPELEHGRLTYNILQAINSNDLYDSDGYLTFNRIVDFVQKETVNQSDFSQTPVIENNVSGFYPFAFNNSEAEDKPIVIEKNDKLDRNFSELRELRKKIQEKCKEKCKKELDDIKFTEYRNITINDLEEFDDIDTHELKKAIVNYVNEEEIYSLKNIIYSKEKNNNSNPLFSNVMQTLALLQNQTGDKKEYIINDATDNLEYEFSLYKSTDINTVSFSIGYMIYQAKWGVVILKIAFLLEWDGEKDSDIEDITIDYVATSLEEKSLTVLENNKIELNEFINDLVVKWNEKRKKELNKYRTFNSGV